MFLTRVFCFYFDTHYGLYQAAQNVFLTRVFCFYFGTLELKFGGNGSECKENTGSKLVLKILNLAAAPCTTSWICENRLPLFCTTGLVPLLKYASNPHTIKCFILPFTQTYSSVLLVYTYRDEEKKTIFKIAL